MMMAIPDQTLWAVTTMMMAIADQTLRAITTNI
jgi:hypothetical protein